MSVSQFLKTFLSEPNLISTGQTCIKGFKGNINRGDKYTMFENRKQMLPTRGSTLLAGNFNGPEFNWCFTLRLTERRSFCPTNHLMFPLHSDSTQPCSNYLKKTFKFA